MAIEMDIVEHLGNLLDCGDTKSVKSIIDEDRFDLVLQERANDLIPTASYYFTKEIVNNKPIIFQYAERIVAKCAEKGNPKECLMEFLAQIESLEEIKFKTLLNPIQTVLLRIPERKGPLMQCVLNNFHSFINTLSIPQYDHLEGKSKVLVDCDESFIKIKDIYQFLVEFYRPFVEEVSVTSSEVRIKRLRLVVLQALFHLLGRPLVFLDLEYNEKGSSRLRDFASHILMYINKLQSDPINLLLLVEDKQLITVEEEKRMIREFSSNEIRFSDLSFASFFYLVFVENVFESLPCVYSKMFIVQNCLTLAVTLLRYKERMVLRKGLLLTKVSVQQVEAGDARFVHLASNVHKGILERLTTIAVYHDVEEDRKLAVELVRQYVLMFEPKAQYYIMLNIGSNDAIHTNIIALFITFLTKVVQSVFISDTYKEYFTGKRLFDLLNIFCPLKKGAETDLVENKEQILSALNLIIFLTRRDRENITEVWNYHEKLSKNFLCPLREGLKLSRAHYKLELNKLNDPVESEEFSKLSVTVGREELSNMSVDMKKEVINSGLTVLDLIEHVFVRATECLEDKPNSSC